MAKTNRCVVRNAAYRRAGIGIRERHNERRNTGYANADIEADRAPLNIHFKRCEGSYTEAFDRMVEDGTISTRGLKQDAKVIDEMVFDVNSAYFEQHGGYEYARTFFEEAYRLAVKEAGGEQYILSAVMHADERNKALSEELGRDVYHYHLHVVYVPVVDKEVKWSKRCKDPALVGTTKEVIHQVSHSKKWASDMALDENGSVIRNENGRAVLVNAYSLLQDRYFEHMQAAGYTDTQRGERGSTTEHLSVLDYKIQQDKERLDGLTEAVTDKHQQAAALDKAVKQAGDQLTTLQSRMKVSKKAHAMYSELEGMGKKTLLGRYELTKDELDKLVTLAKSALALDSELGEIKRQLATLTKDKQIYQRRWSELKEKAKGYLDLMQRRPEETKAALETVKQLETATTPTASRSKHRQEER